MGDVLNTLYANFGSFDGITYALMAIVVVGAAFMMPSATAIVTATCGGLLIFGISLFMRNVIGAKDARAVAHETLNYGLSLPLSTVLLYGAVFCLCISLVHSLRMVAKR